METGNQLLENMTTMSEQINQLRERCVGWRKLMDEGTYKLDAVLNVVNGLKTKEQEIKTSQKEEPVLKQMSEEQINSFLEMLKAPAFQSLARQMLTKWVGNQNQ